VENADYELSYADNVDAGMATVTVTGIGKYAGTKRATFKIAKAPNGITATASDKSVTYKTSAQTIDCPSR